MDRKRGPERFFAPYRLRQASLHGLSVIGVLTERDVTAPQVAQDVWSQTFKYLADQKVLFEGILLKPAMVTPGADSPKRASPDEVADYTLKLLRRRVPPAVPGARQGSAVVVQTHLCTTRLYTNRQAHLHQAYTCSLPSPIFQLHPCFVHFHMAL